MRFLRLKDYYSQIKEDNLNVIIEDVSGSPDERFLLEVEAAALTEVQSYLRHRYDVAIVFTGVDLWTISRTYDLDQVVYDQASNLSYKSKIASNQGNILTDQNSWEEIADPRDAMLKLYLIDITLYHLHSRINPRNIPELRLNRRDEAIKWLTMISKGDISVNLPEISSEDQTGYRIIFGGEDKRQNSY